MKRLSIVLAAMVFTMVSAFSVEAKIPYVKNTPLEQRVKATVGDIKVKPGDNILHPIITWAADEGIVFGNGNSLTTQPGSIYGKAGFNFTLRRMDVFAEQLQLFIEGETPILRMTVGQYNKSLPLLNQDPRTMAVVADMLSESKGEDCIIVKPHIKTIEDLKGKVVVMAIDAPQEDLFALMLKAGGLKPGDVPVKYTEKMTGARNTPGNAWLENDEVAGAVLLAADAAELLSGDMAIPGSRIIFSTEQARNAIADLVAFRKDFYEAHTEWCQKLVNTRWFAAQELDRLYKEQKTRKAEFDRMVLANSKFLFDSESEGWQEAVKVMYSGHIPMGIAGNIKFFTNKDFRWNFDNRSKNIQELFIELGILKQPYPVFAAPWDYSLMTANLDNTLDLKLTQRRDTQAVAARIERMAAAGKLEEGMLFEPVYFFFPANTIELEDSTELLAFLDKIVNAAINMPGAIVNIISAGGPWEWQKKERKGAPKFMLDKIKSTVHTYSVQRSSWFMDRSIKHAKDKYNTTLVRDQFNFIGIGMTQPLTGMCSNKPCWPKGETRAEQIADWKARWWKNRYIKVTVYGFEAAESDSFD